MLTWSQAVLQGAGAAGVAFIGAEYLNLRPAVAAHVRTPGAVLMASASALMLVLLALNWAGIRTGARTQNVLSLSKIVMIAGLAASALLLAGRPAEPLPTGRCRRPRRWPASRRPRWPCFYTYGGYQGAMNLAGDVRDPRRNLPLAIAGGMVVIVIALYLAHQPRLRARAGPAGRRRLAAGGGGARARRRFGPVGEAVVSVAIFLSAAGFVNATILQMPRSYYAMAEDGALPDARSCASTRRRRSQRVGPGVLRAHHAGARRCCCGSFDKLFNYVMFSDCARPGDAWRRRCSCCAGAIPDGAGLPHAGLSACCRPSSSPACGHRRCACCGTSRWIALIGLAILLAGIPLFLGARRATGR